MKHPAGRWKSWRESHADHDDDDCNNNNDNNNNNNNNNDNDHKYIWIHTLEASTILSWKSFLIISLFSTRSLYSSAKQTCSEQQI